MSVSYISERNLEQAIQAGQMVASLPDVLLSSSQWIGTLVGMMSDHKAERDSV